MLVLTRKVGEVLLIEGDISITVLSLRGKQIRLGIEAPKEKGIFRQEIYPGSFTTRKPANRVTKEPAA